MYFFPGWEKCSFFPGKKNTVSYAHAHKGPERKQPYESYVASHQVAWLDVAWLESKMWTVAEVVCPLVVTRSKTMILFPNN